MRKEGSVLTLTASKVFSEGAESRICMSFRERAKSLNHSASQRRKRFTVQRLTRTPRTNSSYTWAKGEEGIIVMINPNKAERKNPRTEYSLRKAWAQEDRGPKEASQGKSIHGSLAFTGRGEKMTKILHRGPELWELEDA